MEKKEYGLVATLSTCQLIWVSAGAIILTLSGLVGHELASHKSLATLPFALMCVVDTAFSIPASSLMLRIGRKKGFLLGALFGCVSGIVSTLAIALGSFVLFCLGIALWGMFTAFAQYYRYAAADGVKPETQSTAISAVVASGIIAVFVGPGILVAAQSLFPNAQLTGPFAALTGLCVLSVIVTSFLRISEATPATEEQSVRSPKIRWRPGIVAGVVNGAAGYSLMVFVMTASPLAAVHSGHSVSDAAGIIQWHLLGMYAPSLVTGWLIHRFGEARIIFVGIAILLASLLAALHGSSLHHFWLALLLLGIGWNLMYVSSSVLLSSPKDASERSRVQAIGEFLNNSTVTVAALAAGSVFVQYGWLVVNVVALPILVVSLVVTIRYALTASSNDELEDQIVKASEEGTG